MNSNTLSFMKLLPLLATFLVFSFSSLESFSAKSGWLFGETEKYQIASNASVAHTKKIVEELQLVSAVFQQLNPKFVGKTSRKLRVIICRDDKTMDLMSPLYHGKPKELGGMFSNDYEGGIILINDAGNFEYSKQVVYHEYVHFLTNTGKLHLPRWLGEGIAEVYSTIEPKGRKEVVIGKPPQGSVETLVTSSLIPMDRFFNVSHDSPEYNSSDHGQGEFYAQSWAFIHFLFFGKTDFPKSTYQELVHLVNTEYRVSEEKFSQIFGIGFKEMEKQLERYILNGRYSMAVRPKPEIEGTKNLELRSGIEGEEMLPIGMVRFATRGASDAAGYLMAAYNQFPQSPDACAYYGYLDFRNEKYADAAKYLQKAVALGSVSPATHLFAGVAGVLAKNPTGNVAIRVIDGEETRELLGYLSQAQELGEYRNHLYTAIGRIWNCSTINPTKEDLTVMLEGAKLYRDDFEIAFYLTLMIYRAGGELDARKLAEFYMAKDLPGMAKRNFDWLIGVINNPRK
jgi:tetratricopeptide (TPR) repeat protein